MVSPPIHGLYQPSPSYDDRAILVLYLLSRAKSKVKGQQKELVGQSTCAVKCPCFNAKPNPSVAESLSIIYVTLHNESNSNVCEWSPFHGHYCLYQSPTWNLG